MLRAVRSFVRREGRMTDGQRNAFAEFAAKYGLACANGFITAKEIFGNDEPLILEIGFGMGNSLLAMAMASPEQNFIGIEVYRPGVGALFANLFKQKINNVRVYCDDALEVLRNCIPDNSVDKVLLFFPDPWPKRRQQKRRIVQLDFVLLVRSKLKPGGCLHIATDCEDYAKHIVKVINQIAGAISITPPSRPSTKFERRGEKLGHKIWDLCFIFS